MEISAEGIAVLREREGCRLTAYKDTVGIWTIGYGHAASSGEPPIPKAGMKITQEEAEEIFRRDLKEFEEGVERGLKRPIAQHEFDAYVSFAYNVGVGGYQKSHSLRLFNDGRNVEAGEALMGWSKPTEIIPRRRGERDQFLGVQVAARVAADGRAMA